jgi:hypothetical protein
LHVADCHFARFRHLLAQPFSSGKLLYPQSYPQGQNDRKIGFLARFACVEFAAAICASIGLEAKASD